MPTWGTPGESFWERDRLSGTRARLAHHGLEVPERWLVRGTSETVADLVRRHLLAEDVPDAVICASDSLAIQVHGILGGAGLRPGTDVALTGFDGLPLPIDLDPPLTSVRIPIDSIASTVIDLLIRQIEGEPPPSQGLIVPTDLLLGGSA